MDRDLEHRKERRAPQYKVLYAWYRVIALASLVVLGGEGMRYWFSGSKSPLALVALVVSVGYWSVVLWSCPDLLSGHWERRLPEYAVSWHPPLIWVPLLMLGLVGMLLVHAVLLFFMVLALMPSLWELLPAMIVTGNLLVTVPCAVAIFRLFWQMRTGRAMGYRKQRANGDTC